MEIIHTVANTLLHTIKQSDVFKLFMNVKQDALGNNLTYNPNDFVIFLFYELILLVIVYQKILQFLNQWNRSEQNVFISYIFLN